jgi:hypothetical protein
MTGGQGYVAIERSRLALYSGRPFRWTNGKADGRAPLDPRFYLRPVSDWAGELDGRYVALRYVDPAGELELCTDCLGAYPVYRGRHQDLLWLSNNPELVRQAVGSSTLDRDVLASVLGGGWSLDGHPYWGGVRRVPRGAVLRRGPDGVERTSERLPPACIAPLFGAGCDPEEAASTLVNVVQALADWPGRPSLVPLTGGRDSRLVLAAALAADVAFEARTAGHAQTPDFQVAQLVCRSVGIPHSPWDEFPHGTMQDDPFRGAALLKITAAGTATLADAAGFPLGPRGSTDLPLWHSGQGGEIARGYYGVGSGGPTRLADRLYRLFVGRRPGRRELLSADGQALVRGQIGRWVDEHLAAGIAPADVPDAFYLLKRMATWAGPTHGCVEGVMDTTSPLWCKRLLAAELGLPPRERVREQFHFRVLKVLVPELLEVEFEGDRAWPTSTSAVERKLARLRALLGKARFEAARRVPQRALGVLPATAARVTAADTFATAHSIVRGRALASAGHPAWTVLDRARVEALLRSEPAQLDAMRRYYIWRLATVFLASVTLAAAALSGG